VFELRSALFERIVNPVPELLLSLLVLLDGVLKVDELYLLRKISGSITLRWKAGLTSQAQCPHIVSVIVTPEVPISARTTAYISFFLSR
jgi:hypothetical protein